MGAVQRTPFVSWARPRPGTFREDQLLFADLRQPLELCAANAVGTSATSASSRGRA
jgi:hypothetical protein